jgi:hypothetical protein
MKDNKVWVRFPNEDYYHEMNIDWSKFKVESEFTDEVFGWYGDIYISILKNKK